MRISSLVREITLQPKTRKMTRLINEALFRGVNVDVNVANQSDMDLKIPMENIEASNELSVKLLFGLSQDETDSLSEQDYSLLLEEVTKKK